MSFTKASRTFRYEIDDDWDVIVVGGGPAGCAAAAAAAREGDRTLLIEATGALGGMGTTGLVPSWAPFSDGQRVIYGGLAEEVFEQNKRGQPQLYREGVDWIAIDPEKLKVIYDELVSTAGSEVRFYTSLFDVVTSETGGVDHVLASSKNGVQAFKAGVYVDCTGDGDLASFAGASYEVGDSGQEVQPASLCFQLSGVDTFAYLYRGNPTDNDPTLVRIAEDPRYPLIRDTHLYCHKLIGPSVVGFNAGHLWGVDATDNASLSESVMLGRQLARQIQQALAEYYPEAFANAHLSVTASLVGIRESRRIMGDYVLTIDDYLERKTFDDEICRNSYPVDLHPAISEIDEINSGRLKEDRRYDPYEPGESHGIPFRCLTPRGLDNTLVAGRCISTDRETNAATRVMPVCLVLGEAAGIAASMAVRSGNNNPRAIDIADLRRRLQGYGAYLP